MGTTAFITESVRLIPNILKKPMQKTFVMFANQRIDPPVYTVSHAFHSLNQCVLHELEDLLGRTSLGLCL